MFAGGKPEGMSSGRRISDPAGWSGRLFGGKVVERNSVSPPHALRSLSETPRCQVTKKWT